MLVITPFLKLLNQLKIYHWQTKSYAEHKAFGNAYEVLDDLIDTFVETYMGKFGVPKARLKFDIEADNYDENHTQFVKDFISSLLVMRSELNPDTDTELQNILDEMTAELEKLLYLLTLK
jgi:hypothetical protein